MHHQHFVHPRRISLGEHRPEVFDDHRLPAFERRIQIRNDENSPTPVGTRSHERGRLRFGSTRAERAWTAGIGFHVESARLELVGTLASFGVDRDPAAGQGIKAELTHLPVKVS